MNVINNIWFRLCVLVLVVLAVLQLTLPFFIKNYANEQLSQLEDYWGRIEDIDVSLLQGKVVAKDLVLHKKSMSDKKPMFETPYFAVNISWLALLSRSLVVSLRIEKPQLRIIAETSKVAKQETKEVAKDTKETAKPVTESWPVRVDRIEVSDGSASYQNPHSEPELKIILQDIHIFAENLTNSRKLAEGLVAEAKMTAKAMGQADFSLNLSINPMVKLSTFSLRSKLLNLPLKTLNPITRKQGNFDFESGTADFIVEADSKSGYVEGYVKPLFHDVKVLGEDDKKRDKDSFFKRVWEGIVGSAEKVVENKRADQSGSRIEFKGELKDPNVKIWNAVVSTLRNAYVKALIRDYEPDWS